MLRNLFLAVSVAAFAGTAQAQCADLTVTNNSGQVTVDLDGSTPMALAILVVGDTTGSTTVSLGSLGSLTLGLAAPFVPVPIGMTDLNGDASFAFTIPATVPAGTFYLQGVTVGFDIVPGTGLTLDLCASDVESLVVN